MDDGRLSRGRSVDGAVFPAPPAATVLPDWYPALLDSVAVRVSAGRRQAFAAANGELLATYWAVGAHILARQNQHG